MKIHKSKIGHKDIGSLPKGKVKIHLNNEEVERIWVAVDEKHNVMYLLNNALMFFPIPSWGMELPYKPQIDMWPYRGDSFDETEFTVCEETYNKLSRFIGENDEVDVDRMIEEISRPTDKDEQSN